MDLTEFARLIKSTIACIAAVECKPLAAIEDSLITELGISQKQFADLKGARLAPTSNVLNSLANEIIRRAPLNEAWLLRLLLAGGHADPNSLTQKYFKRQVDHEPPRGPLQNLPAPTYANFVERHSVFENLQLALSYRLPVIAVVGLGGTGKSCLVREAASSFIQNSAPFPKFEAAVWRSDKGQEGTTSLANVLDTIARVLDYPGIVNYSLDEKRNAIDKLLRSQRVLLVVDNFDTIVCPLLPTWLCNLPEPSKAILTSRVAPNLLGNHAYTIELGGMEDSEFQALAANRLHILDMELSPNSWSDLGPLRAIVGGNPLAIEIAFGLLKHQQKTLEEIVTELSHARGEIFDNLFSRCWSLLTIKEQHVLTAMYLFPYGASVSALSYVTQVESPEVDSIIDRLRELSLLNLRRRDLRAPAQLSVHSLVATFITSQVSTSDTRLKSQDRWFKWYAQLASRIGFCWNDVDRLRELDADGERETIELAMQWAFRERRFADFISISRDIRYYYYVRGIWAHPYNLMRAEAAREIGDNTAEFEALVYHINIASKQHNLAEVEKYLPRITEIQETKSIPEQSQIDYFHAMALYRMAQNNYSEARLLWETNLSHADLSPHALNANTRWLAICLFEMGDIPRAKDLFTQLLKNSEDQHFLRARVSAEIYLSRIEMANGDLVPAQSRLKAAFDQAMSIGDRHACAEINEVSGKLHMELKEELEAAQSFRKALDDYERLGAVAQATEIRSALASLDTKSDSVVSVEAKV